MGFKQFLESWQTLPDLIGFVHNFFDNKLSPKTLLVYADYLEERGFDEAAYLFREVGKVWRDPKLKKGEFRSSLVGSLMHIIGWQNCNSMNINDMKDYWLITQRESHKWFRHIVEPNSTSYRLSLTNGKWFVYKNATDDRVSVVTTRHQATPESELHYPQQRITLRDYMPINVREVPENILMCVFERLLERQVRGSH